MNGAVVNKAIKGCYSNERKAQEFMYKHFFSYAMSIALRYSKNREDSIEIINDSFLKVFTRIKQFDSDSDFKWWLRKIIINTAIDKHRISKNKLNFEADNLDDEINIPFDENLIDQLHAEDIIKVIQRLPEVYKLTFNLYEIEGYSHKEISELLKIDESKSRTNLSRAKKKLRILLLENSEYEKARE